MYLTSTTKDGWWASDGPWNKRETDVPFRSWSCWVGFLRLSWCFILHLYGSLFYLHSVVQSEIIKRTVIFLLWLEIKKNLISEAQELYKHWHIDNPTWILIWWRITKGQVLTRIDGQQKGTDKNPRDKIHQGYFWGQGVKRIHTVCQIQFNFVSSGNSRKNGTAPHKNWQLKIWLNYNKTQN